MSGMIVLAFVASAWAEAIDAHAQLAAGIRLYAAGDTAGARQEIEGVLAHGELAADVRQKALAYLGDILYAEAASDEEGRDRSRSVFQSLLAEAPDYRMDPFEHPPEVCAWFEDLRAQVRVPVIIPRRPAPWATFIPGGAYYFTEGKPATGAVVGTIQLAALGASIATYSELVEDYPDDGELPAAELAEYKRRQWVNRSIGAIGWLSYLVPVAVEWTEWGVGDDRVTVAVTPGTVTVSGTF